ncbi:glycosyl transferase family 41-domain-containing protein [Dipodascopsis uninucleata]
MASSTSNVYARRAALHLDGSSEAGQPSFESLQQLLSFSHERYSQYPQSTSREDLWRLLASLDSYTRVLIDATGSFTQGRLRSGYSSAILESWLLGGCMAYTLGDMARAIEWNYRILSVDPNYVEAMSNLAAALRALKRNGDAESWWSRAVNLRPTYWDAADHLFSLLCSQHRYADAANVLSFVERCAAPAATISISSIQLSTTPVTNAASSRGADFSRYIAIVHAKGMLLYSMHDHVSAAESFGRVLSLAIGGSLGTISQLIHLARSALEKKRHNTLLLTPAEASTSLQDVFPTGLPALQYVTNSHHRQSISHTVANALLTLAKILQDGMASGATKTAESPKIVTVDTILRIVDTMPSPLDILPLYYISFSLHPSPSTANNIGILLASICSAATSHPVEQDLAMQYYKFGLELDPSHPHLYTNLGSLLKEQGRLSESIEMYERAVSCDPSFDIALANLANAVKDQGRVAAAIQYHKRAVAVNPNFDEAVCGLANSLTSVCDWSGRGFVSSESCGVNDNGDITMTPTAGWANRVVEIVNSQLSLARAWGAGVVSQHRSSILSDIATACGYSSVDSTEMKIWNDELNHISGKDDEGSKLVELLDRAACRARWRWFHDLYINQRFDENKTVDPNSYCWPILPSGLALPAAPTVLPFHTFMFPFSPSQIREICRRTALRVSATVFKYPWLPKHVYPPPPPPSPALKVGYVSSDFNNHPLSHLMQSVFGFHKFSNSTERPVHAICYATTASDGSSYRLKTEAEAHKFVDVSSWSVQQIVDRIVADGIHVIVNLNGFTRGARNEIFACRPAPISIAFMGFAGSMGAEWSDYILGDEITIPKETTRKFSPDASSRILRHSEDVCSNNDEWVYYEDVVYCRHSFFCCDHRQSAPDSKELDPSSPSVNRNELWLTEIERRKHLRKSIFPDLAENAIILANFNQLYKIDPSTFVLWLRILMRAPNAVLWLLKFPDLGANNLRIFAERWAGKSVADRIIFTNVADKETHLLRTRVADLVLDTPECNAHTTATDVVWTGTPVLTWPKYQHKMCSRIASSIMTSAFPDPREIGKSRLIISNEYEYEERAVELCERAGSELLQIRKKLYLNRLNSPVFDTSRWTRDIENVYWKLWDRWVEKGGSVTINDDRDRNIYI